MRSCTVTSVPRGMSASTLALGSVGPLGAARSAADQGMTPPIHG